MYQQSCSINTCDNSLAIELWRVDKMLLDTLAVNDILKTLTMVVVQFAFLVLAGAPLATAVLSSSAALAGVFL